MKKWNLSWIHVKWSKFSIIQLVLTLYIPPDSGQFGYQITKQILNLFEIIFLNWIIHPSLLAGPNHQNKRANFFLAFLKLFSGNIMYKILPNYYMWIILAPNLLHFNLSILQILALLPNHFWLIHFRSYTEQLVHLNLPIKWLFV